jgi:hypothetical protein
MSLDNHLLGFVPITVLHSALKIGAVMAVQVGEDAVLVLEAALSVNRRRILDSGHATFLLAILSGSHGSRGLCRSGRERADRGLVEGAAGSGGGAKSCLCWGGKHCDDSQCRYSMRSYMRLRRLESSR